MYIFIVKMFHQETSVETIKWIVVIVICMCQSTFIVLKSFGFTTKYSTSFFKSTSFIFFLLETFAIKSILDFQSISFSNPHSKRIFFNFLLRKCLHIFWDLFLKKSSTNSSFHYKFSLIIYFLKVFLSFVQKRRDTFRGHFIKELNNFVLLWISNLSSFIYFTNLLTILKHVILFCNFWIEFCWVGFYQ